MSTEYNTTIKKLELPEYGRHVQDMIDYCKRLKERAERQRCAEHIVKTMSAFVPNEKDRDDYWQVLWDHLYIMSGFDLDIDFPYEVTTEEQYKRRSEVTPITHTPLQPIYRHYGHGVEKMIAATLALPEGEEREQAARLTALHMKREYVLWNKESVADEHIFADLFAMSNEQLFLNPHNFQLPDAKELLQSNIQQAGGANGKKKNNNKNNNKRKR